MIDSLEFIETELLDQVNLTDTNQFSIGFKRSHLSKKTIIDPSKVLISVPVEKFTEKVFELSINTKTYDENISIRTFPTKVKAVFLVPLSEYENFIESVLLAKVDLKKSDLEMKKLPISINGYPKYVELLRLEPSNVEFIVKK